MGSIQTLKSPITRFWKRSKDSTDHVASPGDLPYTSAGVVEERRVAELSVLCEASDAKAGPEGHVDDIQTAGNNCTDGEFVTPEMYFPKADTSH